MIRVILTDIEGTTSSISFVHDVLFPYAAEHMAAFVRERADDPAVREQLDAVARETGTDARDLEALVTVLQGWIDEDRKATPLKALQGMIWEKGYRDGDFQGHVYDDAAGKLREWHDRGLRLYVYSSGSVQAQKLIYGFSRCGDLTPFFSGYFDTRIGAKRETAAYQAILDDLGVEPETVLFLSDVTAELDAASEAGMETILLVRDGDAPQTDYRVARDFDEVDGLMNTID
ncbi:acireductone synthase [Marinobacter halodurans]|uniref:Enolase-phosphatase E1 n=1 Tax=Marinobacter halodurans TaxID=2528979 RepID=A0ABY1ZJ07_9GAMM|nr:acireductone synthase [Marinobacter halodurans]TBW54445.1 acireductone synthase [Marinobacter halodurans]